MDCFEGFSNWNTTYLLNVEQTFEYVALICINLRIFLKINLIQSCLLDKIFKAMAGKLFLDNILLLDVYSFEGFLNRHKNDEMVNNYSNSCN